MGRTKCSLEIQAQAYRQRPLSRQLRVEIEWIKPIIRVKQIEQSQPDFCVAARESIPGKEVVLPKILVAQA